MRKTLLSLCCIMLGALVAQAKYTVTDVHPLNWWAGMQNPELQILLHGQHIGEAEVSLTSSDIAISRIERPTNDNYIILYVNTQGAAAQKFNIVLKDKKGKKTNIPYELQQRTGTRGKTPFTSEDVMYLIMPDRFANADTSNDLCPTLLDKENGRQDAFWRHGGDVKGITQHMDYLADLGITALWLCPTQENDMARETYHGYAITNYYKTDARLGTNEEYREMVDEAHKHGIKVVMDLVFNHCGSENFLYKDMPDSTWFNNNSKYIQTSYKLAAISDIHAAEKERFLSTDGWFTSVMIDFNHRNYDVMTYLIQTGIWWTEWAGIDGIRQDTYPYCDLEGMKRWNLAMEEEYPGYNIVGETWVNYPASVAYWQKDSKLSAPLNTELKTVMDFPLMYMLDGCCDEETDDWDHGFARLYDLLSQDIVYANTENLLTFLDNHDTSRFANTEDKAKNLNRYRQALTLLLTLRGIPQLYYGDEIGMVADKGQGDGMLRQDFPGGWAEDTHNAFTAEGRTELENDIFNFTRTMLQWRKGDANSILAHGKLTQYTPKNGCYVYQRSYNGRHITVVLNGTNKEQTLPLEHFSQVLPYNQDVHNVLSNARENVPESLKLEPRAIRIYEY